ncbi:MAG: hypothetical protein V2A63_01140 [Patescibacteria group bacterium]
MKIFPPHSRRLLFLALLLTVTVCTLLWGFDTIVESAAVKTYLLAAGF